jgi:two-component system sensor histidine kinase QseC
MSWLSRRFDSLRGRLSLTLAAGIIVTLGLFLFVFHLLVRAELYGHLDRELALRMQSIGNYAVAHAGKEATLEFMPRFRTQQHRDFFQIWDQQGRVLARSDSSSGANLPLLPANDVTPSYHDIRLPDGHRGRAVAQYFPLPPADPRGQLAVVTAEETEGLVALEARLHWALLFGTIATIVAALIVARFAVRRSLQPLESLARSISAIQPDGAQMLLDVGQLPTELRPVADKFEEVLQRLMAVLDRERRFTRNVAHELRTPLAEVRMLTEVGSLAESLEESRARLREAAQVSRELEHIVESLLSLARYESGTEKPNPEPVELGTEIRRQLGLLQPTVEARRLRLHLDLPTEHWLQVDSTLFARLLANLLGNAITHSPDGSTIEVTLLADGALQICNPAPHLSPESVKRLEERFFTIHSSQGNGWHAGLGLPLARAGANVLGIGLTLTIDSERRFVAMLERLPRLATATQNGP